MFTLVFLKKGRYSPLLKKVKDISFWKSIMHRYILSISPLLVLANITLIPFDSHKGFYQSQGKECSKHDKDGAMWLFGVRATREGAGRREERRDEGKLN